MENCASYSLSPTNPGDGEESHEIELDLYNLCLSGPFWFHLNKAQLAPQTNQKIKQDPQLRLLHNHKYKTHHRDDCLKNLSEYYAAI